MCEILGCQWIRDILSTEYAAVLYVPIVVRTRGKKGNEAAGRERIHAKYVRY